MLTIVPATEQTAAHLGKLDARSLAGELVQVRVTRKGFVPEYAPLATAEWRQWEPAVAITSQTLQRHADWACLLAFLDDRFVGQAAARQDGYGLCKLMDLQVDVSARRQGIGSELLSACMDWAVQKRLKGLWMEMTDQNPAACQFLQSCEFVLGGVDKLRHYADPKLSKVPAAMRESVLAFYKFFG